MADIAQYWRMVGGVSASLPSDQKFFYVTSIEDEIAHRRGGVTVQVPRSIVGQLVVGGSHRLASDAEIEAFDKAQQDHAVEVKMKKLNTENHKAVEMFDALSRLQQANLIPATEPAAKKAK